VSDGIVVVDKPAGLSSHDVVARVRRLAATRQVGHAGTLDPMATGVLVLGIGKATRLLGYLALASKSYDASIRLGQSTSTDDAQGEVLTNTPAGGVSEDAIRAAATAYVGAISQVPSRVSAVKVGGQRAYRRARSGEQFELTARPVLIESLDVTAVRRAGDLVNVELSVRCSSGTYVRALARDIGADLGVGGHLTRLRRTAVGPYGIRDARTLDELAADLVVTPLADVAAANFPTYEVGEERARWVTHGRQLPELDLGASGPVAVFGPTGDFLALYEQRGGEARALAVFVG
jgi:tRNA pseudouridine55 synthase